MLTKPENYIEYDEDVMTNFDHTIDKKVAKILKKEEYYAQYSGWNFRGKVWWNRDINKWCCEVLCYLSHVETVEADTLDEIMIIVSNKYGDN